jgi:ribosomal-protein-alanine N-acetyltransferase
MKFFNELPVIMSQRLCLRPLVQSDADDIFSFTSNPLTVQYLGWHPHQDKTVTEGFIHSVLEKYKRNEPSQWGIELKEDRKIIGISGFVDFSEEHKKAEIAFVMSPDYQGKGYMTEANRLIVQTGFEILDLNRIQAKAELENYPSQKVLEKTGMIKEGILRDYLVLKNTYRSYIIYSILKKDFAK